MGSVIVSRAANAGEERVSIAELDVTVWRPESIPPAALPVLIFSHGFHGCATQSRFLMTAFDWKRCGLVGHSLGGYTLLGLGGAWPSWRFDGIKAVLALSPYVQLSWSAARSQIW